MEADMAEAWQTLEEAALTLGISSRTLHRRLARGEFQTRMANGRREVLVIVEPRDPSLDRLAAAGNRAAPSAHASAAASDTTDTPADADVNTFSNEDYNDGIDGPADQVQQTMLALHEDRIRRTDLAIMAYQQSVTVAAADARRAITRSRVAWGMAALLTVTLSLGGMWATHRLTQASGQVSHLSDNVRQLSEAVEVKTGEINELRQDAQTAKVAAARAEGELAAAKRQVEQLTEAQQAAATAAARLSAQVTSDTSEKPATQPSVVSINGANAQLAGGAATSQPSATTQPVQR
jgi:outer membrane murein-binding lipoprotein Lpp